MITRVDVKRKRPHFKSKRGCGNCRFRRVKCDERKPSCQKCLSYMVPCVYDRNANTIEKHYAIDSFETVVDLSLQTRISAKRAAVGVLNANPALNGAGVDGGVSYQISPTDLELLDRFQHRTVHTLGTPTTASIYRRVVVSLSLQYGFLCHTLLAVTMMHDRALLKKTSQSPQESFHYARAAALLNRSLPFVTSAQQKDALFACAVYLCTIEFFAVNTDDPEHAWPLESHGSSSLEWLNMQAGLKVVYPLVAASSAESAFRDMTERPAENCVYPKLPLSGTVGVRPELVDLCDLHETSSSSNNPYHIAAHSLSGLWNVECTPQTALLFMTFAGSMQPEFKSLLRQKDPLALTLLAIWYSKVCQPQTLWWMAPRGKVECQAICLYLERNHASDRRIYTLLKGPKSRCGLVTERIKQEPPFRKLGSDAPFIPLSRLNGPTSAVW